MEFRKVLVLRGPSIWARFPVLEAWVDLANQPALSQIEAVKFHDRLKARFPSLVLEAEMNLAQVLERLVVELQESTGAKVEFGRTAETSEPQIFRVVAQYEVEGHGRACLTAAHEVCLAELHGRPYDLAKEVNRLKWLYNETALGPSTRSIVQAARERGIAFHRLCPESLVQLGDGSRQRRFRTAVTDQTGAAAHHIAQDKELTKVLLRQVGVPVPEGRPAESPENAWEVACEIGLPVVIKPRDGNHGRGVTLNLKCREHVMDAYRIAAAESTDGVIVERYAPGTEHRVLVVGGKVVAALRGEPDQVFGDGVHTVTELVDEVNRDPRRGEFYRNFWKPILMDDIATVVLDQQGLRPDSIPEAGRKVVIHQNGEYVIDCTDEVHPEVAARAVLAAQTVGLDVAGMDMIATDIGRPLEEQGGVIVEVNAGPGIYMHYVPLVGKPRPVGTAILETMFPPGESGRIPLVSVAGTVARTETTQLITHLLRLTGLQVGMTTTEGTFLNSRRLSRLDGTGFRSVRNVRLNPWADAGVFETSAEGILHESLGFDECDVAVVTHLGDPQRRDGVIPADEHAILQHTDSAFRTLMNSVATSGWAVLKADDPATAALAEHCRGGVIYFAQDEQNALLKQHREQNGPVVFLRERSIILSKGRDESPLGTLEDISPIQSEQALAAVGAAWALKIPVATIREGLLSFATETLAAKLSQDGSNGHSRNGNGKSSPIAPSADAGSSSPDQARSSGMTG